MQERQTTQTLRAGLLRGFDRLTVGVVAGVLLLVCLGIGVVLIGPSRFQPADESTPQGVVTIYLQAVRSNQPEKAYNLLASTTKARISLEDFTQQTNFLSEDRDRIEIVETTTTGDNSRVIMRYSSGGGLFGGGSFNRTALLARENGQWRITLPTEPFIPTDRPR